MEKAQTKTQSISKKSASGFIRHSRGSVSAKKGSSGIVVSFVHGSSGKSAPWEYTPAKLIQCLKTGLPVQELDDLRNSLDLSMERLVPMLGISKATLHRRMTAGRLDSAESDRVVRFAKLMGKAVEVMESPENARKWLSAPQVGLGGAIPLEYAETEVGAREVENLLGRIEYGVYS
jgi:putative toxin-antitoxin system antitoxin component (TIGR02293 family)